MKCYGKKITLKSEKINYKNINCCQENIFRRGSWWNWMELESGYSIFFFFFGIGHPVVFEVQLKVNQSRYRFGVAQRVPGS